MRRGVRFAMGAALGLLLLTSACQGHQPTGMSTSAESSPAPTTTTSATPTVPPPDPLVTLEVCGLAAAATDTTTTIFNEQMSAFELAAARGDRETMETAAKAVNQQFVSLAQTATRLAERPVEEALRDVLEEIAEALDQMTALSYTGTTVDQRKKLVDFTLAINDVCAPATAPAVATSGAG